MHGKFYVNTDHQNLKNLFNNAQNFKSGKLYRWAVRLQDFHFQCDYVPAEENKFADYLSSDALPWINNIKPSDIDSPKHPNRDIYALYANFVNCEILGLLPPPRAMLNI